jgi:hypothetical protein
MNRIKVDIKKHCDDLPARQGIRRRDTGDGGEAIDKCFILGNRNRIFSLSERRGQGSLWLRPPLFGPSVTSAFLAVVKTGEA